MQTDFTTCFDHSGSVRCGRLSLRPHVAVANFSLVQPKSAGGETLFSAKLSTIESPLIGLFTGVFRFLLWSTAHGLLSTAHGLCQIELLSPFCTGSKIVIAIQEATVYLQLDAAGVPHWINLLEVGATQASKATMSGTAAVFHIAAPYAGSGRSEGRPSCCTSSNCTSTQW